MNENNNLKDNNNRNNYFKLVQISTVEELSKIYDKKIEDLLKIVDEKEEYKLNNSVCRIGINDVREKYGFVWNTQLSNIVDATSDYEYKVYRLWASMIRRVYGNNNCTVCNRWLYFSNFISDIPKIPGFDFWLNNECEEKICLDKDIKSRVNENKYNKIDNKNKEYSLENCMFVPESINHMVAKRSNRRGDGPIGVSRKRNKFRATINIKNIKISENLKDCYNSSHGQISLGVFKDRHSAFLMYKINKELLIQENAKYMYENGMIYKELYETLLEYKIKEND